MTEFAILDLYHFFVEVIFGNFLMAVMGIGGIFAVIGFLLRMSLVLVLNLLLLYFMIMFIGFFGSLVAVFIFTISGIYFVVSIIRWWQGMSAS